jgi:ribokinase
MPYDLVCLGNLSIDDIVLPDQTTRMNCFGGDTIYAALGGRWWSDAVRFVAPVGDDYPKEHFESLNHSGMDTRGLPQRAIPSVHYQVIYKNNNQRTWIMKSKPGDFLELSPTLEDIPSDYREARAFLVLAMDLTAQETLAPVLRSYGLVALDPQEEYIPGNEARLFALLKDVDIFLPSKEEVSSLLGHRDCEKACHQLAEYGPRVVVVKMGDEGSLVFDSKKDRFHSIPVFKTKVVDTTGAGDAYCGGFMAMYVRSGDLLKAGLAGAVSASFAIQDFGLTHMFSIGRAEAEQRFQTLEATCEMASE